MAQDLDVVNTTTAVNTTEEVTTLSVEATTSSVAATTVLNRPLPLVVASITHLHLVVVDHLVEDEFSANCVEKLDIW